MFSSNEWIGWFKNWNEICDRKSIRPIILWYRRYVFRSQPNGCLSGVASGERQKRKKNNTRDSNVVPHRSTNLARWCLTSLSRREAVLSSLYGRSWMQWGLLTLCIAAIFVHLVFARGELQVNNRQLCQLSEVFIPFIASQKCVGLNNHHTPPFLNRNSNCSRAKKVS